MKLGNEAYALEAVGVQEEGEFRIARSGKAFRALIDGLYADKHQSIVRELSANAFDSHQRVGQSLPFYIHLPTEECVEFFIRDYGVGMTHDTVMNLYSTMFESDKTATNDEVGMFGLGSKTPFAYTDQFYVICYDGSTSRQYVAAIGRDGVPRIMLMVTEACDEPTGVRVGFSVESADFREFRTAVEKIVLGYEPRFDTNVELSGFKLPAPVFKGEGWAAYVTGRFDRGGLASWNVRQGCVIYPVESVGGVSVPADNKYTYLFDAPIGKVSVTTSRERIEYKAETVKFLKERIEAIQAEITSQLWEQVKDIRQVVGFFNKINSLRPDWLKENYTHPITRLTTPTLQLTGESCFFEAADDSSNDRWSYNTKRTINLIYPNMSSIYILDDVTPLLDAERPAGTTGFTKTEHRRLARYTRTFAASKDVSSITIAIGVSGWSEDFWACALPDVKKASLTVAEMKAAFPKRQAVVEGEEVPTVAPPIRGLGLARANGETSPVFAIEGDRTKAAWVKADLWRTGNKKLQAVAKRFGITSLYVASPTAEEKCSEIRTLQDAVLEHMKGVGLSLTDVLKFTEYSYYNKLAALADFGKYLLLGEGAKTPARPDLYDKLCRARGTLGEASRHLRPYIENGFAEFESDVRQGLSEYLFKKSLSGVELPASTKKTEEYEVLRALFSDRYRNSLPLYLLDSLNNCTTRAATSTDVLVEALLALNRISPVQDPNQPNRPKTLKKRSKIDLLSDEIPF